MISVTEMPMTVIMFVAIKVGPISAVVSITEVKSETMAMSSFAAMSKMKAESISGI